MKTLQVEENERMERPTLKSILAKNRPQSYASVEELDESYYVMDGSRKHVTFDDDDNEEEKDEQTPPIETEENGHDSTQVDHGDEQEEEEEEVANEDLIAEFDEIPSNLSKLENRLLEDKNTLNIIWKRINDKRLPPIPKSVLTNYFDVLLDYYTSTTPSESSLNQIGKHLLHLIQIVNNEQTKSNILNRLKQYHITLTEQIENETFTQIDSSLILYLKLIAHLYPTSDFRHPITTPALTLLIQSKGNKNPRHKV